MTQYIGNCGHEIPEEWYNSEESSYTVLNPDTGITSFVTSCKECKERALEQNLILNPSQIEDDFEIPDFGDDAPDYIIHADGTKEYIGTPPEEQEEFTSLLDEFKNL